MLEEQKCVLWIFWYWPDLRALSLRQYTDNTQAIKKLKATFHDIKRQFWKVQGKKYE